MTDSLASYRARWIIPVAGPPVENGIVVVRGDRIVGVHRALRADTIDLGEVAIVPGFVNCHTHLEFSRLERPLEPMARFTDWIRSVVRYRRDATEESGVAIRQGLQESLRGGVALLGDIATTGWNWADYQHGPACIVFQELLGLTADRQAAQRERAESHVAEAERYENLPGLSPHAPYSVHPDLFRQTVQLANAENIPVAMHLAETEAERELLSEGTGEFRGLLEELGLWQPAHFGGRHGFEFLDLLSELSHPLVIHGNFLSNQELLFLAQHPHMTFVYCPRTHAAFGHPPHPWQRLLDLGGTVALGTDGRASNPDLSLWSELQFLAAKFPEVSQLELLRLATLSGARALGQSHDHGSLEAGKLANLVVIGPVPEEGPALHRQLITPENRLHSVMCRGAWTKSN